MLVEKVLQAAINFFTSSSFVVLLILLVLLGVLTYCFLVKEYGVLEARYNLPSVKPVPFFGSQLDVLLGRVSLPDFILNAYKAMDGHPVGIIYAGRHPAFFIRDAELIKTICTTDFEHFQNNMEESMDFMLKENVFSLNGHRWKSGRALLANVFRSKYIKEVMPSFNLCSQRVVQRLNSFATTQEALEIGSSVLDHYCIDAVGHAGFSIDLNSWANPDSIVTQAIRKLVAVWRLLLIMTCPEIVSYFKIDLIDSKSWSILNQVVEASLTEHRYQPHADLLTAHLKVQKEHESKKEQIQQKGDTFEPFTDTMIYGSTIQLFLDGVETTSSLIAMALFQLAHHQDIQDQVHQEIVDTLDSSEEDSLTFDLLSNMKYLDQVFQEVCRLAAFPFITKICTKDYVFPGTQIHVSKDTKIYLPILGLHMDPKYFPQPDTFDPDRFGPAKSHVSGAFIPFGIGHRQCLGKLLVATNVKSVLAHLIRHFQFHPTDRCPKQFQWDPAASSKIKGGVWLTITNRSLS